VLRPASDTEQSSYLFLICVYLCFRPQVCKEEDTVIAAGIQALYNFCYRYVDSLSEDIYFMYKLKISFQVINFRNYPEDNLTVTMN